MKILHVICDLSLASGGPVTAVKEMACSQVSLGHDVAIAATDYGISTPFLIEGVNIMTSRCDLPIWRWSHKMGKELPRLVRSADIVHIHTIWEYPVWAASRVCSRLGRPFIIRPCGMLDKWSLTQRGYKKKLYLKLFAGSAFSNANAMHFTSEGERLNSLSLNDNKRAFVLPIGISLTTSRPDKQTFIQRYPELKGHRLVLFMGRLHNKKQPDILIKAFSQLVKKEQRLSLVLAGPVDMEYKKVLQELVASLGLNDKVVFTGLLDRNAVLDVLSAADIFVLPSLQENFGISVAEAMSAGCPVVISDRVDLAPDVLDFGAGLVCSPTVESTAESMDVLLSNDVLRNQMGDNGRRLIKERFTQDQVMRELLNVYRDIITGKITSSAWRNS